jgi:hypothetical protein
MEEHAWRFRFTFPQPLRKYGGPGFVYGRSVLPKQKKSPEVRNALREKRITARQKVARYHAEVALHKYNTANNTKVTLPPSPSLSLSLLPVLYFNVFLHLVFQFELVEIRVIRLFFEFGGGCIHYNFTAKSGDHHIDDDSSTKLFFSEVNASFQNENDVVLCCIVGGNDAGTYLPRLVYPASCLFNS